MRTAIRKLNEKQVAEMRNEVRSQREAKSKVLVESLIRRPNFGAGLKEAYDKDPRRVENLAYAIKHMEEHLSVLTEAQIASTLGTAPENVLKVLRLGYLNTCRQDAFWEMGLQTAHDVYFYLEPKYKKSIRGAKAGDVMYESPSMYSASDIETVASIDAADGSNTDFTFDGPSTVTEYTPFSPFTIKVYKGSSLVGTDNGRGKIVGVDEDGTAIKGLVEYATGTMEVQFVTAPKATEQVTIQASIQIEADSDLEATQEVELSLKNKSFNLREYPITASFSKKLELTLATSYKIDAEEAYMRAMAGELKKTLDYQAFRLAYTQAHRNSVANQVTFDMHGAVGESEDSRIQVITRKIDQVGTKIYEKLQRGGVTKIFGGAGATGMLKSHRQWSDEGSQMANGIYKLGKLGDIDVFRTPESVCPSDELTCVYKSEQEPEDVFLMIGTLVPLYVTDKITLANRQTQMGVAYYGDLQINQKAYAQTLKIENL